MAHGTCVSCGVVKRIRARAMCSCCYQRAVKAGDLSSHPRTRRTFAESMRIARLHETEEGCWPWPNVGRTGYPATTTFNGCTVNAHVAAWIEINGPVPKPLTLDHLCHTNSLSCRGGFACLHRRCVRPEHLELATYSEQQHRSHSYRSAACGRGHIRTETNTHWQKDDTGNWYRRCRDCGREDTEAYRARMVAS